MRERQQGRWEVQTSRMTSAAMHDTTMSATLLEKGPPSTRQSSIDKKRQLQKKSKKDNIWSTHWSELAAQKDCEHKGNYVRAQGRFAELSRCVCLILLPSSMDTKFKT